ncbi:MAG: hypothetical protein H7Z41_12940 [Cytophagales bacterium]|nr:hypothetical protein [Armatimonadota bacterium]
MNAAQPSSSSADPSALIASDPEFLALLACPLCADRPPLRLADDRRSFSCDRCGRVYPITDGFPDLRPTEAEIAPAARES